MERQTVIKLNQELQKLSTQKNKIKFSYFIAKNLRLIKNEIESLQEMSKPDKQFEIYEKKRVELAENYCDKDEHGKSIVKGNAYKFSIGWVAFENGIADLRVEFATAIEEREKQLKQINDMMKEEIKIDLYKIDIDNLPVEIEPEIITIFLDANLIVEV